jgi:hypothetical protein
MKIANRLVPILITNVVVWLIYAGSDDPGFPWPIFVTIGSISGAVVLAKSAGQPGRDRQRNRNRHRNR